QKAIDFIYMVAPTTDDTRLSKIANVANGFIYYVSVSGITGTKDAVASDVSAALTRIRRHTVVPVAVGFGIKTPKQAAEIARYADATVVGSALVSCIEKNIDRDGNPTQSCAADVLEMVRRLSKSVRN
ncbi:uncharacterized protein METZ01_LOCUS363851, partial [marine metagenome]